MQNMQLDDLHGFGPQLRRKAHEKLGVSNLGELVKKPRSVLCEAMGKVIGETIYKALRGITTRTIQSNKPRRSVSAEINVGTFSVS